MSNIVIKESSIPGSGSGVFALENFTENDIIEFSPFVLDKKVNWFKSIAKDYVFKYNDEYSAFGLGYTSMYNHQNDNNAKFVVEDDGVAIIATKPIYRGEEIFISYGHRYWKSRGKEPVRSPSLLRSPSYQ